MTEQPAEQPNPVEPAKPAEQPQAAEAAKPTIVYDDFAKLDLRVGKVLACREHPNADKLIVLDVDLGGGQVRQICAGLKAYVQMDQMVGKNIIVVANLEPRRMRGLDSQGMLLAATHFEGEQQRVTPLSIDPAVPPGSKVS